jgi:hypothetical protein
MVIELAKKRIMLETMHSCAEEFCGKYAVSDGGRADFCISVTQADVDFERTKSEREDRREGIPVRQFSDEYLETLAVYRKVAERMPLYDVMLLHGSCIAADGQGYLFTAKSGTGKSTHTRLWREMLGERAVMVNDDKPLIRVNGDGTAVAYGTPWDGKHHLSSNVAVPLRAICILERSEENRITKIPKQEALPMLFQQAYRPMGAEAMQRTITMIDRLAVRFYRLSCNMDPSAAALSYGTMKED